MNISEVRPAGRVALVIGNAAYKSVPALDNPVNDSRAMCAALRALSFDVKCIDDVKSRRELKNHILDFAERLKKGNVGLFFYAGHGVQIQGDNFLLPTEAQLDVVADVEDEGLSLRYLMSQFESAKADLNIVILDACRNNPLGGRNLNTGLAAVEAPQDTVLVYATSPGKQAFDGTAGKNGLFTGQLLKFIATPGLTLEEMIKSVIKGVQQESLRQYKEAQSPWVNFSFSGRFCFAGCDKPPAPAEVDELRAEKARLETRTKDLERRNAERDAQIQQLELEIGRSKKSLTEGTATVDPSTKAVVSEMEEQVRALKLKNEKLREESAAISNERHELDNLRKRVLEMERLAKEYDELTRKLTAAERQQAGAKAEAGTPAEDSDGRGAAGGVKRKKKQVVPPPSF